MVIIDGRRRFDNHIDSVRGKPDVKFGALRSILPKMNGPPNLARRLYYNVWDAVVMYGVPV